MPEKHTRPALGYIASKQPGASTSTTNLSAGTGGLSRQSEWSPRNSRRWCPLDRKELDRESSTVRGALQWIGTTRWPWAIRKKHRVQVFSTEGSFLFSDGNIIVADKGNKRVVVFTPEGRVLLTLHGDQLDPRQCIFHGNRYFVSDCNGSCIKVFSDQGDFLYQFGRKGTGDCEFDRPLCLALDKSGQLVVCDSDNSAVSVGRNLLLQIW